MPFVAPQNILISAGELSGDRYAADLVKALKQKYPETQFWGMGGEAMKAKGVKLVANVTSYSTIGLFEPLRYVGPIYKAYKTLLKEAFQRKPDLVIVIDYQGFHMMLLKVLKKCGFKTVYFIAPQEWQWGTDEGGRAVAAQSDLILSIFKPEHEFYSRLGANSQYVGHPILDRIKPLLTPLEFREKYNLTQQTPFTSNPILIGLFPGSRPQEWKRTAPILFEAAALLEAHYPQVRFAVSVASKEAKSKVLEYCLKRPKRLEFIEGEPYSLIQASSFSLTVSGTVTLEHALLGTPCIVGYAFSPLTYWFGRTFLSKKLNRIPYMSLPNLLLNKPILPEFLQSDLTVEAVFNRACLFLNNAHLLQAITEQLIELKNLLGEPGVYARVVDKIHCFLGETHA